MKEPLLERFRRKKVVQWLLAYAAGAWALIEVVDLVAGQFGWPPTVGRATTLLVAVGAVGAAVAAWFHGERGRQRVSGIELAMFAGIMVLAAGTLRIGLREPISAAGAPNGSVGGPVAVPEPQPERASIAVLPFSDMSPEGDQRYFSDGVAEEILNRLAAVPGLRVAARTSSFAFRDGTATADSIGRALGVAHILEGSVRKQGLRVRVTAQLIDASDAMHLWSRTFDSELRDVFEVQDEIAKAIADTLRIELGTADVPRPRPTNSLTAHDRYLRGRDYWYRRGPALDTAVTLLREAVEADPEYAPAWALLGHAYALLPNWRGRPWAEVQDSAHDAVRRALVLDPGLPQAYAAAGEVRKTTAHWAAAEGFFERALELNPGFAEARQDLSDIYRFTGRIEPALRQARLAYEADPLSIPVYQSLGLALQRAGRHEDAVDVLGRGFERNPWDLAGAVILAWSQVQLARYEEAVETLKRLEVVSNDIPAGTSELFRRAVDARRSGETTGLSEAVREVLGHGETLPVAGLVYAVLEDREGAVDVLERMFAEGVSYAAYDGVQPRYDFVRDDPRVRAVALLLGLPETFQSYIR